MKRSLALFTAALWPVTTFAQNAPPVAAGTGAPVPAADTAAYLPPGAAAATPAPIPLLLARVEFQDADLPSIIEYLKEKNEELSGNQRDLNIILSPGLERLRVPMLSLRNVTVNDVLTIATTVLNVQLEPVASQTTGDTVAWIVKAGEQQGPFGPVTSFVPDPGGGGGLIGVGGIGAPGSAAPGTPGTQAVIPGSSNPTPAPLDPVAGPPGVVELAAGGGGLGGLYGTTPHHSPATRVFGVAALIASKAEHPDEREKERSMKFDRLINSLQDLAGDQGRKAEVKAYRDMEIIVVKSGDPEAIGLIADTIDAMKMNIAGERAGTGADLEKHRVR